MPVLREEVSAAKPYETRIIQNPHARATGMSTRLRLDIRSNIDTFMITPSNNKYIRSITIKSALWI